MTARNEIRTASPLWKMRAQELATGVLEGPKGVWLLGALLVLLYLPVLAENMTACLRSADFTHGILIFPIAAGLIWLQRDQIGKVVRAPEAWGLVLLALGLVAMVGSYLLRIKFIGLWSLIPVLAGAILAVYGRAMWRIARFPVCLLFLAGPIPNKLYFPVSFAIQTISTQGAAWCLQSLGYIVLRTGNQIETPGYALEVADVCSGFQKLITLIAFALVYGYLFRIGPGKRLLLVLSAFPIAVLANALRITGLVAVISARGLTVFHAIHDLADMLALVLCFALFILTGRLLGCTRIRFLP